MVQIHPPIQKPPCLVDLDYLECKLKELTQCLEDCKRDFTGKPVKKCFWTTCSKTPPLQEPCTPETCNTSPDTSPENCLTKSESKLSPIKRMFKMEWKCNKNAMQLQIKQLLNMERDLKNRELELIKKCNILDKKIEKFEKCKKEKEMRDRMMANKLKRAQQKIYRTLHSHSCDTDSDSSKCPNLGRSPNTCRTRNKDFQDKLCKAIEWSVSPISCCKKSCCRKNSWCSHSCSNKGSCCKKNVSLSNSFFDSNRGSPQRSPVEKTCWSPFQEMYPCRCSRRQMKGKKAPRRSMYSDNCYLMSHRKTPQLWIYNRWPQFYPHYLSAKDQCKLLGHSILFLLAALLWSPILFCLACCCHDCC